MRRRQPKSVMTGMAVVACAALLVSGCTAPAGVRRLPSSTPQATVAPPAAPPPVQPPASFAGLDARMQQATADAAASGATIEAVVLDRNTGEVVSNGSNKPFPIASVVKLFIADDLLLQESEGKTELSPPTASLSTSCCAPRTTVPHRCFGTVWAGTP